MRRAVHPLAAVVLVGASLLSVLDPGLAAAGRRDCGTVAGPEQVELERRVFKSLDLGKIPSFTKTPVRIPIKVHIVRNSQGGGGLSTTALDSAFHYLNQQFVQAGMRFHQWSDIHYIDNDIYYNNVDEFDLYDILRQESPASGVINVYFTQDDSLCGQSSFPLSGPQGIIMNNDCAGSSGNPSTFAHEVGHYFNLYHTHETVFGAECPSGSNCATAGDQVCDTPADPDLSDNVATGTCAYTGPQFALPGCDSTPYSPSTVNLMSYSLKECRDTFTVDQQTRMWTALLAFRPELFDRVHYVDSNAVGSADNGTPAQPYLTVAKALINFQSGDKIVIAGGNYAETPLLDVQMELDRWDLDAPGEVIVGQ